MSIFEAEHYIVNGVITSIDRSTDEVGTAYENGMTAIVLYPKLAQGGICPEVGALFSAKADIVGQDFVISPYGFMAVMQTK